MQAFCMGMNATRVAQIVALVSMKMELLEVDTAGQKYHGQVRQLGIRHQMTSLHFPAVPTPLLGKALALGAPTTT